MQQDIVLLFNDAAVTVITIPYIVGADHIEDEHDSEDEQDVFALEGRQGQGQAEPVTQTLDEAAADPTVSRGGWEGAAATQDVLPVASTSHTSPIDETADSLDSLMELTFDHLVWRCQAGQLQRTWAVMLSAFERTLLHTYRSKFTQFLVYYMCQQVCFLPCNDGAKEKDLVLFLQP